MKSSVLAAAVLLLGAGLARVDTAAKPASQARPATSAAPTPAEAKAVIDRYCATCHNPRTRAGNLAFDTLDVTAAGREAPTWEKVVRKVRTGMMPPSGAQRPDRATLDGLASSSLINRMSYWFV